MKAEKFLFIYCIEADTNAQSASTEVRIALFCIIIISNYIVLFCNLNLRDLYYNKSIRSNLAG